MNLPNPPHHSDNALEEILKELEDRFSSQPPKDKDRKKNPGINFSPFTQQQILGGITLVLLLVGAATGFYLGNTDQDTRQRAVVDEIYATATPQSTTVPSQIPTSIIQLPTDTPDGQITDCNGKTDWTGFSCGIGCNGKVGDSCGTSSSPAHCDATAILGCGLSISCTCAADPPPDNPCSAKPGAVCVAPGSACPYAKKADGLCTLGASGPICCIPKIVATSTVNPTSTNIPPTSTVPPTATAVVATTVPPTATTKPQSTSVPPRTLTPAGPPPLTPTNSPTLTPNPTTAIGPVCANVMINTPAYLANNTAPHIGDMISLTCAQISGANGYKFRIRLPNFDIVEIPASITTAFVSQEFRITKSGGFSAQCTPCIDDVCAPWE